MAILLKQGTLNPLSTTLANDLRLALLGAVNDAITAGYTKWAIVDNDYVNGTTKRSVITNTDGHATMLINSTVTDNTNLLLNIFFGQSYTLATHTLNNVAFGNALSAVTSNATGFTGVNYTPTNAMVGQGYNAGPGVSGSTGLVATASQTNWACIIEQDYIYFSFKDGGTDNGQWFMIGRFDSLVTNTALTDTYPFCFVHKTAQYMLGAHILNSLGTYNYNGRHTAGLSSFIQDTNVATLGDYDRYSATYNKAKLSPVYIIRTANYQTFEEPTSANHTTGYLRGKLPNAYHGGATNAVWGDTVTINSQTYMYIGGSLETTENIASGASISLWVKVS